MPVEDLVEPPLDGPSKSLDLSWQLLLRYGVPKALALAAERAGNFGLFIRSIVGLDRAAAKGAFADFLDDRRYSKNQIEFINMIIDVLTDRGVVEVGRVYQTPYDGVAPEGPEAIFVKADLDQILDRIKTIRASAA